MLRDTADGYRYLEAGAPDATPQPGRPAAPPPDPAGRLRTGHRVARQDAGVRADRRSRTSPVRCRSPASATSTSTCSARAPSSVASSAGRYGQLAFSVPSLGAAAGRSRGRRSPSPPPTTIARSWPAASNTMRNLQQRPASAAVWLARPLTPRLTVRAGYEWDYTHLAPRAPTTAPDFAVPASQVAHGIRVSLEGQRRGWESTLWWNGARRAGWRGMGTCRIGRLRPRGTAISSATARASPARSCSRRGWSRAAASPPAPGGISTASAGMRSAPSTTGCGATRRR